MSKYKHSEHVHNLESPQEIVPKLVQLFKPQSVVDIGCGIGTFLHVFKKEGVQEVLGVDGPWVNKELLHKYISEEEFQESNLEQAIKLKKRFDLAISLEVAEHLSESAAKTFVQSLVNAGRLVVFSAAIPLQGGQNHINEQWLSYWEELFSAHNYELHDVLRPIFWDNEKIFSWYKQNMVVFALKDSDFNVKADVKAIRNMVHYELFELKAKQAEMLHKPNFFFSLKLLIKSIIR